MADRTEITKRLALRLKEERAEAGLSLDALAKLSGVSRSMLSQIERAESSPTVASLWNLTRALNVDFASLLDGEAEPKHPIRELVRADNTPVIRNRAAKCEVRILSSPEEVGGTEVYDIRFSADGALESAPHKIGCIEHVTVLEGSLRVISDGKSVNVNEGDTVRYAADVEHTIEAPSKARALLIVRNA